MQQPDICTEQQDLTLQVQGCSNEAGMPTQALCSCYHKRPVGVCADRDDLCCPKSVSRCKQDSGLLCPALLVGSCLVICMCAQQMLLQLLPLTAGVHLHHGTYVHMQRELVGYSL